MVNIPFTRRTFAMHRRQENSDANRSHKHRRQGKAVSDFSNFNQGDYVDDLGVTIEFLILKDKEFIVFLDEDLFVWWDSTAESDFDLAKYSEVMNRVSLLESYPISQLPHHQQCDFRRLLGEAVARCFVGSENGVTAAHSMLDGAVNYINARAQELSRYWLLCSSLIFCVVLGLFSLGLFSLTFLTGLPKSIIEQAEDLRHLTLSIGMGAVGALASVLFRSNQLGVDPSAGKVLHYFEGGARILVGAVAGFLLALAIKANLILGIVDASKSMPLFLVLALAAGVSEKILPNLVNKLELVISERNVSVDKITVAK